MDEARFRCEEITESLEAMAVGIELCPLEDDELVEVVEPPVGLLDRLESLVDLVGRGVEVLAAAAV